MLKESNLACGSRRAANYTITCKYLQILDFKEIRIYIIYKSCFFESYSVAAKYSSAEFLYQWRSQRDSNPHRAP